MSCDTSLLPKVMHSAARKQACDIAHELDTHFKVESMMKDVFRYMLVLLNQAKLILFLFFVHAHHLDMM